MIKSMTGFGRGENTTESCKFTVEMKSVNHRYLDINMKMPKKLGFFEAGIRNELKQYISRGKLDIFITYEDYTEGKTSVRYNRELAEEYLRYLRQMASELGLEDDIRVSTLSRYPEVFTMEEQGVDEDALWQGLRTTLRIAAENFVAARIQEGESLLKDMEEKLTYLLQLVSHVEERSPEILEEYRDRLRSKVEELLADSQIEESRILTETAIFADKICVDEETVRLRSHIENTRATLQSGGSIGRKLDFIAQEMNREANTILSKANDLELSGYAIEMKTEIEKLREQIQNIE